MSDTDPLYDIMIVSENHTTRVPEGVAGALIRFMAATRIIKPVEEALAQTWAEVYSEAGDSAHDAFVRGGYDGPKPVFLEAVVRWGTDPVALPYGGAKHDGVYFYVEFRGSRFPSLIGKFKSKFKEFTHLRPQVFVRPHEEPPPHATVPEGEERKDTRLKRKDTGGLAGTRVEEF